MDADDIAYLNATDLVAAYRDRSLSPLEVTRTVLDRIDALNPKVNAFILVDHEAALRDAAASEARWQRGEPAGPLDGVPTSVKDLLLARGWPTLRGSRTTVYSSSWAPESHIRAAASGVFGSLLGHLRFFVSADSVHQAPEGGGMVAVVFREGAVK